MFIQQDDSDATFKINRYEPGSIWINQQCYHCSVIIRPHHLMAPWEPKQLSDVTNDHFAILFDPKVEIVLIGTGSKLIVPSQALLRPLYDRGIGVEFMDSRAACHTYTVLAAESRNVAACIIV